MSHEERIEALAELIVRVGANVQPDQVVSLHTEPGGEPLARAVAEAAYEAGARFVDLIAFDPHFKRARVLHAHPDTLGWVPPWWGERLLALAEMRGARISLAGPSAPRAMEGLDPALVGRDMFPRVKESTVVLESGKTNWVVAPNPTPGWAELVHPDRAGEAALAALWDDVADVCRLDEPDPVAAWHARVAQIADVRARLDALELDAVRFDGPGTELTVGLLPGSRWTGGMAKTVDGIPFLANIPTEEVFTTPDPARTEGYVTATKPLFAADQLITGLRVHFAEGRAVEIDADEGGATLRSLAARDENAARLGEVALVDRESRIGKLGRVFSMTLLDENAASHIALGQGYAEALQGEESLARMNRSAIHIDFMIGSEELDVTGLDRDGREIPLLRGGAWQV